MKRTTITDAAIRVSSIAAGASMAETYLGLPGVEAASETELMSAFRADVIVMLRLIQDGELMRDSLQQISAVDQGGGFLSAQVSRKIAFETLKATGPVKPRSHDYSLLWLIAAKDALFSGGAPDPTLDDARAVLDAITLPLHAGPIEAAPGAVAFERESGDIWIPVNREDIPHYRDKGQAIRALYPDRISPVPPPGAIRAWELIQKLREGEGDSVTILCENPDPEKPGDAQAIECCGGWTMFNTWRFKGPTVLACLESALAGKSALEGRAGK